MTPRLCTETKISPWGGSSLLAIGVALFRLAGLLAPAAAETWDLWAESLDPLLPALFPLTLFQLLEREKVWRTLEVLVAVPTPKRVVLATRTALTLLPLVLVVVVAVPPGRYLAVVGPGLVLGGACLTLSLLGSEEIGLVGSLAWWGASLALLFRGPAETDPRILRWLTLFYPEALVPSRELLVRRLGHLALGGLLLGFGAILADLKRSWSPR